MVNHLINTVPSLIREELDFDVNSLIKETQRTIPMITAEQSQVFKSVMQSIERGEQFLYFVDARGGCGKIYLLNALIDAIRCSEQGGCVALAMATTGIAATLLHKGRTFHSRTKAPINPNENSTLNISYRSTLADLLR